jgi:bifunctional DNA-binding transcriptional regulator/antitoxin component of YhaV-PrlF toxin-antitoxin module
VRDAGKIWWVALDDRGRLTMPPELLRRLGIRPGAELALILGGQSVYIHPVHSEDPVS